MKITSFRELAHVEQDKAGGVGCPFWRRWRFARLFDSVLHGTDTSSFGLSVRPLGLSLYS